jgi:type II secretory pathway pseudopilin PulG
MLVVSIIALISSIAVPNYIRARKRAQAGQIRSDLRMLDAAIQHYIIENSKSDSSNFTFADILVYTKPGTQLHLSNGKDMFGNTYIIAPPNQTPKINPATFATLSDVAPAAFWSPHID